MTTDFHDKSFREGTKLKLDVFRRYIREYVSVFMTDSPNLNHLESVNIFDFFSGPGCDVEGNAGTPFIIIDEIRNYCKSRGLLKSNKLIKMYFNDLDVEKIETLQKGLPKVTCPKDCCQCRVSSKPFNKFFDECLPLMRDSRSANLVIMDQFGISDVTPDVVRKLADCTYTDVLFFIPSSHIHRFQKHPAFSSKIDLNGKDADYLTIHRVVCDYYREKLNRKKYFLAPFSIKDGKNIHGIIFGSSGLYGLEKFLNVCWSIDPTTGEANYSVDRDPAWDGDMFLFPEMNEFKKINSFECELQDFIDKTSPDNLELYQFVLTKGFTPPKASESLRKFQDANWLKVEPLIEGKRLRKGTFYLNHLEKVARIRFKKG